MHSGLHRYHGLLLLREGKVKAAEAATASALETARSFGGLVQIVEAEVAQALVVLASGDVDVATDIFETAIGKLDVSRHRALLGRLFSDWADDMRTLAPERAASYDSWTLALTARGTA